ncbi:MAG: lantibiotic transport system permease protein [Oceanotoga sp.]|jgi:ABC-2 type transport system permease protein|uniref:lantibiotic immunity ABC transporter MutG family permease subunit n=1 Tax=Oceanotoga sp. TaxID=2108366 RepID=UPI002655C53B|nr:lantibiotic immunity ABC transporter MutG family permease subunit [Oceanotoga sp.]MDN5341431.1 lantibiotic transport system permease protein [Oceanotoga sp.]
MLLKNIKSDFFKLKKTPIIYIHIIIPILGALTFLSYYSFSNLNTNTKITIYIQIITILFPLLIGIITGIITEQEEKAGNFQNMFCINKLKYISYTSKLITLLILSILSIILALGIFAIGFKQFNTIFYIKIVLSIFTANIFLYNLHLMISLKFGKASSIGIGIIGMLISALMQTGLGDKIWHIMPWSWAMRFCDYIIFKTTIKTNNTNIIPNIKTSIIIILISTLISIIITLCWFNKWEGKKSYE